MKERGAFLHNIMPLISDPAHGTHFGLTGQRGPTAMELKALQDKLTGGAKLMRHCRQCRADAVGLLGEDRGQEFTLDQLPEEVDYDPSQARRLSRRRRRGARRPRRAKEKAIAAVEQNSAAEADRSWSRSRPRAAAASTSISATPGNSRSTRPPPGVASSATARSTTYCMDGFGEDATLDAPSPRSTA